MKNKRFIIIICLIGAIFIFLLILPRLRNSKNSDINKNSTLPRQTEVSLKNPFEAKATIKLRDLTLVADLNKTAARQATFSIKDPPALNGMTFIYNENELTVSYKGLSVKLDENSKLVKTAMSAIIAAIDKASTPGGVSVSLEDSGLKLSGETDSGGFDILLDRKNGSIARVSLPELELECSFDDFLFTGE